MSAGTAYAKRYGGGFVNLPTQTTAIDQTFLNNVETALLQLIGSPPSADGQVAQWDFANTRFGPALLLNKNVDPAAAIVKSKLDLTGANGIVDADIAGAAAISRSKLNFGAGLVNADIAAAAAIAPSKLSGYPADATKVLKGDGTWAASPTGSELAYNEFTSNVAISATAAATANTVVTASAVVFDGAPIIVTFYTPLVEPGATAASTIQFAMYIDGAQVGGTMWYTQKDSSATIDDGVTGCMFSFRTTPAAGSHTYSVRAWRSISNGTVFGGGGFANGFIRITKV